MQRRYETGKRSHDGDTEAESSCSSERLLKARQSGELPKGINVDDYTLYLSSIIAGLSIQAANGSTKEELKRTAKMALRHLGF
jgi:hypothetical protein